MAGLFDWWSPLWPNRPEEWPLRFWGASRRVSPPFATLDSVRLDLGSMQLRERCANCGRKGAPILIVGPYALHDSSIADFASGHSLAEVLDRISPVSLIHWKSATPEMRFHTIDTNLADLNIAMDDLGGRAVLVGLCQGGWLAMAYAARFPHKVAGLVLAGAPIDLAAEPSAITRAVARLSPTLIEMMVSSCGGRVPGQLGLHLWSCEGGARYVAREALQCEPGSALAAAFDAWNNFTVDLPGPYFLQSTEWLFRENRLAAGRFAALGRICDLSRIESPVIVVASREDEIVSLGQATRIERLCPRARVRTRIVEGVHLSIFMGRDTLANVWTQVAADMGDMLDQAGTRRSARA